MSGAPINEDALLDLVDRDAAFLETLVDTFLEDCTAYVETIRTAVAEEDPKALARAAHSLKGAAANLQAPAVRATARRLEEMGRTDDLDGAAAAVDELDAEVARLRTALTNLVANV